MNNNLVLIGKVIGVFGIKGELKIYSESDFIEQRFSKGSKIYLVNKKDLKEVTVTSMRIHKKTILITIDNLYDINEVEKYVNYEVFANKDDKLNLEEDEYYLDDLIGLNVLDEKQNLIGTLNDFIEVPQGYIMEILSKDNKYLIPFTDEHIIEIKDDEIIVKVMEIC